MKFAVIGGGIAGVCCVEELCRLKQDDQIVLISATKVLKGVDNVRRITKNIEEFAIVERDLDSLPYNNLEVIQGIVISIDTRKKIVQLESGKEVGYDKLCICTGARPKELSDNKHVLTIRDTNSIEELCGRLSSAQRVILVGNGGIALELMQGLSGIEIVWVLKHGHVGDAFFDVDAAEFLLSEFKSNSWTKGTMEHAMDPSTTTSTKSEIRSTTKRLGPFGHAAGPKWLESLPKKADNLPNVSLERNCEVASVVPASASQSDSKVSANVKVELTNGHCYHADFVISAIGVDPQLEWLPKEFERGQDGGILVNFGMETSVKDVYAAGDACTMERSVETPHWFQMRLWTQARIMGTYVAHCMVGVADDFASGFNFELFTHVTRFCGKKVIFLGLYNGQHLEAESSGDLVAYSRVTEGESSSFVRIILLRGRMQGAVLIGETDLEEAFENVILDGVDLSGFGADILDPDLEFDHIFD